MISSPLNCYCSICRSKMDWRLKYGQEGCCCCKTCWKEFNWRQVLSTMGEPYRPDPEIYTEEQP